MKAPKNWLVLTASMPSDDPLRELLGEGLLALGGLSVLEESESLTTYLALDRDPEVTVEEARHFLAEWIADDVPPLTWRVQPNEDWEREWRRGLQPRKVSSRFVVKPSWTTWQVGEGEVVLEIDPQMAFGTGEHATTRGCLRLLDEALQAGDRVLDIGSGSGILSIAAAKAGASEVVAIEYDPDANVNARENIERNGVADRIVLREELADPQGIRALGHFDLVIANILSGVIIPLLPAIWSLLEPGGRLITSGVLRSERAMFVEAARGAGFSVVKEDTEEEWLSVVWRSNREQ